MQFACLFIVFFPASGREGEKYIFFPVWSKIHRKQNFPLANNSLAHLPKERQIESLLEGKRHNFGYLSNKRKSRKMSISLISSL